MNVSIAIWCTLLTPHPIPLQPRFAQCTCARCTAAFWEPKINFWFSIPGNGITYFFKSFPFVTLGFVYLPWDLWFVITLAQTLIFLQINLARSRASPPKLQNICLDISPHVLCLQESYVFENLIAGVSLSDLVFFDSSHPRYATVFRNF